MHDLPSRTSGGFVDIGRARVYLEAWGAEGLPSLLCLHGLGGGTHFFGALGAALASQCRTVAIDLPGSGMSPLLDDANGPRTAPSVSISVSFSFDEVTDLIVDLARDEQRRGGGQPVCLLGHSMGTILALEAIRRAPDLASSLIIVGGLPEPLPSSRTRIRDRAEAIRQRGIVGMGAGVIAANFSTRSQRERPELTACFAKLFERQDPAGYVATAESLAAWTARTLPALDRVSCLAIAGEEDRYAPPDALHAFARTLPASTRVEIMPDCGHLPFLEQPSAFAAIVSAFLQQAAPPSSTSKLV